jgi:hypothetical protein
MGNSFESQYQKNLQSQIGAGKASGIYSGRIFKDTPIAGPDEVLRVFTAIMRGHLEEWELHGDPLGSRPRIYCALEAARALAKHDGLEQAPSENERDRTQKAGRYNVMVERILDGLAANGETATREEVIAKIAEYDPEIRTVLVQ